MTHCIYCRIRHKGVCKQYLFSEDRYLFTTKRHCNFCEIQLDKNENEYCVNCIYIVEDNMIEDECPVCLEHKKLNTLPCKHNVCFDCCKQIYIGTTDIERPLHWSELPSPNWPYVNIDPELHNKFSEKHKLYDHETMKEFINHRDYLVFQRPKWAKQYDVLEFERETMEYYLLCQETDDRWNEWMETKKVGNRTCPLCRASP